MLSDDEQRVLEQLERGYATDAPDPVRAGRPARRADRPPGARTLVVLAAVSASCVLAGAPTAGLALGLAAAIGWSSWRLWARCTDRGSAPASPVTWVRAGHQRRPGASIREYLAWLAEAD